MIAKLAPKVQAKRHHQRMMAACRERMSTRDAKTRAHILGTVSILTTPVSLPSFDEELTRLGDQRIHAMNMADRGD